MSKEPKLIKIDTQGEIVRDAPSITYEMEEKVIQEIQNMINTDPVITEIIDQMSRIMSTTIPTFTMVNGSLTPQLGEKVEQIVSELRALIDQRTELLINATPKILYKM